MGPLLFTVHTYSFLQRNPDLPFKDLENQKLK